MTRAQKTAPAKAPASMKSAATSLAALALLALGSLASATASAQDKVNFGLDWKAEPEYGGFYQAVATGIYKKHNLDVTIRQGGPQVNQAQLLLAGRLDFNISGNSFLVLNLVKEKLPFRAVAAMFQKDPAVLIAHPGQGNDSFAALKGKPIMIGSDTRIGWWNFLKAKFGYDDSQIRPYNFNLQPFLADKRAVQQGYVSSEPFSIEEAAQFKPVVLLLADAGFTGYGSLITTSNKMIAEKPELVQRFLNASFEGWYAYLYGDPKAGNELIKKDNPEMTDALIAYGRTALKSHGIVDSGDTTKGGIGAMSDARWADFLKTMASQGLYPADLPVKTGYTSQFVNKGFGVNLRKN